MEISAFVFDVLLHIFKVDINILIFSTYMYICIICQKDYKIFTVVKRCTVKMITTQFTWYFNRNKLRNTPNHSGRDSIKDRVTLFP